MRLQEIATQNEQSFLDVNIRIECQLPAEFVTSIRSWLLRAERILRMAALRLAGCGLTDFLNIGKIAHPASRKFGSNQIAPGDEKRGKSGFGVDHTLDTPFPGFVEIDAVDARKNIDRNRLLSDANELTQVRKIALADPTKRRTECGQGCVGRARVCRVGFDEKVHILCRARLRVEGNGIAANDKVFNAVGVEDRQEFFEVVEHRRLVPSWHKRRG